MKYQKPEVLLFADAVSTIESFIKPHGTVDNPNSDPEKSSSAYEADE